MKQEKSWYLIYKTWLRQHAVTAPAVQTLLLTAAAACLVLLAPILLWKTLEAGRTLSAALLLAAAAAGLAILLRRKANKMGKDLEKQTEAALRANMTPAETPAMVQAAALVAEGCARTVPSIAGTLLLLVGSLLVMVTTHWRLGLMAVLAALALRLILYTVSHGLQAYEKAGNRTECLLREFTVTCAEGFEPIRISRAEEKMKAAFSSYNSAMKDADRTCGFLKNLQENLSDLLHLSIFLGLMICGTMQLPEDAASLGMAAAFGLYFLILPAAMKDLEEQWTILRQARTAGSSLYFTMEQRRKTEGRQRAIS